MKFRQLAIAGALAVASTGSFAAYGDIVFTEGFSGSFDSKGAGSITVDFDPIAAGLYNWEAAITGTGNIVLVKGQFNSQSLTLVGTKYLTGSGPFGGGDMSVFFDFVSGAKPGGSYGGSLTITSAVPEPETYALMLAGLGVVGFVALRRKVS